MLNTVEKFTDKNGDIYYRNLNGEVHREDGPALINSYATSWAINGKYHREDGPAIINISGDEVWYRNGLQHRDDGPAFENKKKGYRAWLQHGKFHRLDGPAIENVESEPAYFIEGKSYTRDSYYEQVEIMRITAEGTNQAGLNLNI